MPVSPRGRVPIRHVRGRSSGSVSGRATPRGKTRPPQRGSGDCARTYVVCVEVGAVLAPPLGILLHATTNLPCHGVRRGLIRRGKPPRAVVDLEGAVRRAQVMHHRRPDVDSVSHDFQLELCTQRQTVRPCRFRGGTAATAAPLHAPERAHAGDCPRLHLASRAEVRGVCSSEATRLVSSRLVSPARPRPPRALLRAHVCMYAHAIDCPLLGALPRLRCTRGRHATPANPSHLLGAPLGAHGRPPRARGGLLPRHARGGRSTRRRHRHGPRRRRSCTRRGQWRVHTSDDEPRAIQLARPRPS